MTDTTTPAVPATEEVVAPSTAEATTPEVAAPEVAAPEVAATPAA